MERGRLTVMSVGDVKVDQLGPWSKRSFGDDLKIETRELTVRCMPLSKPT